MHKDIHAYYRALGLSEGAGPTEIRRAYRHMVQTWHPDLFKPGSPMQMTAEDITKEVNEAYEQLYRKKLYRRFPQKPQSPGEAEPAAAGEPAPVAGDDGAAGSGGPNRAGASRRPRGRQSRRSRWWPRPWNWKRLRPTRRLPWKWAAVAAGMGLAAYAARPTLAALLKSSAPPDEAASAQKAPEGEQPASPAPWTQGAAPAAEHRAGPKGSDRPDAAAGAQEVPESERPAPPSPRTLGTAPLLESRAGAGARPARVSVQARTTAARPAAGPGGPAIRHLTSFDAIKDSAHPAPRVEAEELARLFERAGALLEIFDVGDSKARVLEIQGTPDDAGETVFRYGSSLVYFERGRVTGWADRVPWLHVRPWSEHSIVSLDTFSLGSTRGDVIRAQGEPSAFTPRGYFFGSSYVYFENDVVAGWSPGDVNLRSFDMPVLPFRDLDRIAFR